MADTRKQVMELVTTGTVEIEDRNEERASERVTQRAKKRAIKPLQPLPSRCRHPSLLTRHIQSAEHLFSWTLTRQAGTSGPSVRVPFLVPQQQMGQKFSFIPIYPDCSFLFLCYSACLISPERAPWFLTPHPHTPCPQVGAR